MTGPDDRRDDGFDRTDSEELDELLAALALDAVDDAERVEIERLLADAGGSAAIGQSAERYQRAADWLSTAVEPVDPPPGLWNQIAAQLDAPGGATSVPPVAPMPAPEDPIGTPTRPTADSGAPQVDELAARRAKRDGWTPLTTLVSVAAAFVVVLVITVAALAIDRNGSSGSQDLASAAQEAAAQPGSLVAELTPTEAGPGMHAQVVVAPDGLTYFVGDGLPALPEDQAYQLWSVNDAGEAVSVGVLGAKPAVTMLSMGADPGLLAVTVEPAAGSVNATTNPIVAGVLA